MRTSERRKKPTPPHLYGHITYYLCALHETIFQMATLKRNERYMSLFRLARI